MLAPEQYDAPLPLELLRANEEARIVELLGDASQVHRLAEMGLRVGADVRMVRPGSPCVLALGNKRLSLRLCGVDVLVASSSR